MAYCGDYDRLVFIDLETTGANPIVDRITEVGLVEVTADGQVSRWSTLVNPEISIPPFIQSLTGINNAMVQHAPIFASIAEELLARLQGALFIAHNARFDYGFLRNAFKELGHTLRCDVLCTVKLSRKLHPEYSRHSLDALIERHGLVTETRHRALADADLIWQFWTKMTQPAVSAEFEQILAQLLQRPTIPTHLDPDVLDEIPDTPGVYFFYGENSLPLYVGKSIHLRQRVMSHFSSDHRVYSDMRMSHQIHRVEWRETAGEVGALMLEAKLVKEMQPIHNRVLRRQRELCGWQLRRLPNGLTQPVLTYASEQDFGRAENLYGLFSSRRKAEEKLRALAEAHQLCLVTLGLENRVQSGKPCFARQLKRCLGACVGEEALAEHHARLEQALDDLRVVTWPFSGAVALVETGAGGRTDFHVIENWAHIGTASDEQAAHALLQQAAQRPSFDADTYKILVRALLDKKADIRPLLAQDAEPAALAAVNA
jgi:DNA polymerase-3 subunit epsilon